MKTENKIYWTVAVVSVLIMAAAFIFPGEPTRKDDLPWHIEHPAPNAVRIFGLTIGEATINDAEKRFTEEAKPSLFMSNEGKLAAEAFFEQVDLAGLRSKIVVTVFVPEKELKGMYERGVRMSSTGRGKKITLAPDDVAYLRTLPINSLTYMPSVRVNETMFIKRFGEPSQRIREKESGAVHWLYPQNGLDITLGGDEKPLMQYVSPKDFTLLIKPLQEKGEVL